VRGSLRPPTPLLFAAAKERSEFVSDRARLFFWNEVAAVANGSALDVGEKRSQGCRHIGDGPFIGTERQQWQVEHAALLQFRVPPGGHMRGAGLRKAGA
jgi:hypothetical protein